MVARLFPGSYRTKVKTGTDKHGNPIYKYTIVGPSGGGSSSGGGGNASAAITWAVGAMFLR